MGADVLPVSEFARVVTEYADALDAYQEEINGLNVYPVPDGDTGTNLRLTLGAVRAELDGSDDPIKAIIRGSLMGARGNSGVIMSQIFRGLAEAIGEADGLGSASLTDGLRRASDLAYQAVMQPQEGTILTVIRESAEAAEAAEAAGSPDLTEHVRSVLTRSRASLAATPDQLPVLKQAGVVDAGGRGLVLLLECMLRTLDGTALPQPKVPARTPAEAVHDAAIPADVHEGSLEFRFEVQFLLDTADEHAEPYRRTLARYGDCVLVVGGQGLYNVHVHTNEVGTVLEEALAIGRPRQIDVQYLEGQVAEQHEAAVLARLRGEEPPGAERERIGLVAVAAGDGILTIFGSFGVRGLVRGGQTFNPSAEEILDGIRRAHADEVIVLPNNRNVIASARTAAEIAIDEGVAKRVEVLPTESPLQAFTALVAFDRDSSLDENVEAMSEEGLRTKHGEVAVAVRDADTPVGHVNEGQCIGLSAGQVCAISDDPQDGVVAVLEHMLADGDELVTLVYGAEIDEWSAHELGKRVGERFKVDVEVHRGGQPHYPFLIGVE